MQTVQLCIYILAGIGGFCVVSTILVLAVVLGASYRLSNEIQDYDLDIQSTHFTKRLPRLRMLR